MKIPLICVLILTCAGITSAQQITVNSLCKETLASAESMGAFSKPFKTQKVAGSVTHSDQPIESAIVIVTDKNFEKVIAQTLTGATGKFSFDFTVPQTYYLMICKPGFNPQKFMVKFSPKVKQSDEIKLELSAM